MEPRPDQPTLVAPPPPPPPYPPPDPEPGNRIGMGMLLAIALLAAAAAAIAVLLVTRHHHTAAPSTVIVTTAVAPTTTAPAAASKISLPVPNLVGRPWRDAVTGLKRAGFAVTVVTVRSALPRGTVTAQQPANGKLARGSEVRLNVSAGAPATSVTTTHAATTTTQPATTTTQQTTTQQPTTPAAAADSTQVPSLSGQLQSAVQQLYNSGFVASIAYVPGNQALGTVVAQSPTGGASAPAGSQVTVNVSSGPNGNPQETVPNVVGQKIPQALSTLQHTGLRLIFLRAKVKSRSQAGVIVAQTPAAGKQAPKNAQVLVYMGAYQH